jgi:uracil-DNA glycosylase
VVVAMGTTAVRAVLGKPARSHRCAGMWFDSTFGPPMVAMVHPSAIVRGLRSRAWWPTCGWPAS